MPFESRTRALSKELSTCKDEKRAVELARELQSALHEEIELMRTKAKNLALLRNSRLRD
jgi:hypothetical protein